MSPRSWSFAHDRRVIDGVVTGWGTVNKASDCFSRRAANLDWSPPRSQGPHWGALRDSRG